METLKTAVNGSKEPKEKALSLAVAQIERQFGKGAIMRLGAQPAALDIAVISTGAISLDAALGLGGIPRVRPRSHSTSLPRCNQRAALPPLSMPNMPSTRYMPRSLG